MAPRLARAGDVVVECVCRCGTEWVLSSHLDKTRSCGQCHQSFSRGEKRTLDKGGAL